MGQSISGTFKCALRQQNKIEGFLAGVSKAVDGCYSSESVFYTFLR